MSFVQRELNRIQSALSASPKHERYAELYAAQQALAWVIDPGHFAAPHVLVTGTSEGSGDYPADLRPPQSLCIDDQTYSSQR